ncbi:MAG TPA: zinc-dependent metalloprotease family protein [Aquaticitalea sp.]|nr:zinc-dependent metalloprotease family protein [Aquaticitalea sp.]
MKQLYTKINLALMLIVMFSLGASAQQTSSLWTKTAQSKLSTLERVFRKTEPSAPKYYHLNIEALKTILQNTPKRGEFNNSSYVVVDFPTINDKLESFRVMEASVMHASLQAQFPEIRSYVGQSLQNPSNLIRFSVTPQGLHTMFFSGDSGTQFIDPYTKTGNFYIVYAKRNLPALDEPFICEFIDETGTNEETIDFDVEAARNANDGMLRTYDLALACTIEYSAFHVTQAGLGGATLAEKKAAVLTAMNVTMTRVNGVYEKELALSMVLVPNNLDIIFIDSDTFNNDNANFLIGQSQSVIDGTIGSSNYDIGHTFSTGGGGLAGVNVPCVSGQKARGITGSSAPVGDPYDIDYVAHEMGHQFGSNHTFNGSTGNCAGGNRSALNAYEPGSGTTIMAYAGICAPQNVQANSDDYFHQRSLAVIWANISTGVSSTCSTNTPTGNAAPTAEAGANYTIPKSTPYRLTGSSTDADGIAAHTYTWEQYDLGAAGVPTETTANGPLVRSFRGTTNPTRVIPQLPDLLQTGGSTTWEKLVSIARTIDYRLTVRDNSLSGGQTAVDNMMVTTVDGAGPFLVTSQTEDQLVWTPSTTQTVTWNVAGTTGNGVNTSNVNILLSTDGGLNYDTVLIANTPNDGSENITVPSVSAPYCRVMVEAVGNIFFSINNKDFAVGDYTYELSNVCEDYTFDLNAPITESTGNSYPGTLLPISDSYTISDIKTYADITHPNIGQVDILFWFPWSTALNTGIWYNQAACTNADMDKWFDLSGTAPTCSTNGGDPFLPYSAVNFTDAIGQNSAGEWRIYFKDNVVDGSGGTLNTFTIQLCQEGFTPVLSVEQNDFEDSFSIFPNPNNGEFSIKLRSHANDIKVEVYDIRGRSIYSTSFDNNDDLNQTINLNNVQSGMYLVKVSDGDKQATKKIIVE